MPEYRPVTSTHELALLLPLINDAYRGTSGAGRWTTEHHLVAGDRLTSAALTDMEADPQVQLLAGFEVEQPVCCIALKHEPGVVEFGAFAVASHQQGRGLGSALLNYAEHRARRVFGVTAFRVCVVSQNRDLIRYYQRRGYRLSGKTLPYPVEQNVGTPLIPDISLTELMKG